MQDLRRGLLENGGAVVNLTRDELLDDFDRVTTELGHYPSTWDYREHGEFSRNAFYRRWDSWQAVKDASRDRHLVENRLEGEALREAGRKGGEATARKRLERDLEVSVGG